MTNTVTDPGAPLMDVAAVAAYLGRTPNAVRARLSRARSGEYPAGMPEPSGRLGNAPYWEASVIREWAPYGRPPRVAAEAA